MMLATNERRKEPKGVYCMSFRSISSNVMGASTKNSSILSSSKCGPNRCAK